MGEVRNTCIYLVGKPVAMVPLGRSGSRSENNIEMELNKTAGEG
jgi:hypothetical protein